MGICYDAAWLVKEPVSCQEKFDELLADPYGLGFHEDEVYSGDEAEGCGGMVPVELLVLEDDVGDDGEDHQ